MVVGSIFNLGVFDLTNAAFSFAAAATAAAEVKAPPGSGLIAVVRDGEVWLLPFPVTAALVKFPLNKDFNDEDSIDLGVEVAEGVEAADINPDEGIPFGNLQG